MPSAPGRGALLFVLATMVLGPVLLPQALWTRRSVPRLPEAAGPRHGSGGTGPPLRLLICGDSAAAGVGAERQVQALSGQLLRRLEQRFTVHWRLEARSGATTAAALAGLQALDGGPFDVAITSLGVNDVISPISLRRWLRQQRELRELLRERFGVTRLLISGLPPMHAFPALPQPLRWYLGLRASRFDAALRGDLENGSSRAGGSSHYLGLRFSENAAQMAADGMHPGPGAYAEWARSAAELIPDLP